MPSFFPVFPLKKPISYVPQGLFSQLGRPEDEVPQSTNVMYFIGTGHTEYLQAKWAKLIQARIRVENARRRFSDASTLHSTVTPLADIPGWKDATIESFRLQFRLIDLNRDGLIDYKEMCAALDKIDDHSSDEKRREYFRDIDKDQSDGIDFEEFLELLVKVHQNGEDKESCLSKLCQSTQLGIQVVFRITQLLPQEQIKYGLF